jgi:hypothetical protein
MCNFFGKIFISPISTITGPITKILQRGDNINVQDNITRFDGTDTFCRTAYGLHFSSFNS